MNMPREQREQRAIFLQLLSFRKINKDGKIFQLNG